ncbi:hypothetical protein [Marinobacter sp.]|uniref:hypothetical protein n=1 Tax=Marinobacter sp. TaxID=50741 RepID=UPI0035667044
MNKRIFFSNRETHSRLRNGLVKTIGVEIADLRYPSVRSRTEEDGVLQIQAVNSKEKVATGYVEIPFQESVLRGLAYHLLKLAAEASGSEVDAKAHGLELVVDHQIKSQSMAYEDFFGILDEILGQFLNGDEAAALADQGLEAQLKVIVTHGLVDRLLDDLTEEGIWDRNVVDSIYEQGCQRVKAA